MIREQGGVLTDERAALDVAREQVREAIQNLERLVSDELATL
jgi:hypothetical protein